MIRPTIRIEFTIDLPKTLVDSLGVGAEMLAQHLTLLADTGATDSESHAPPLPVLCRICERQITPWWFPKHTELCLEEHRAEAELGLAEENLTEHRTHIVKVLDSLESHAKSKHLSVGDHTATAQAEYKGLQIGTSNSSSGSSSSAVSRSPSLSARDPTNATRHHFRQRSFTVRRPLSRIVELVLDLCDTALEINTPALKDAKDPVTGESRSQSPQSEGRIAQVLQWQSPSAGALENETGLSMLCDDTAKLCKLKVEAIVRYRQILEYSERIRSEFTSLIQECIDAALDKASRLAAGESGGSSSDESTSKGQDSDHDDDSLDELIREKRISMSSHGASAMAIAMRSSRSPSSSPRRQISSAASNRSSSPRGCPTPKSRSGGLPTNPQDLRQPVSTELDQGGDSDSSRRSSVLSQSRRTESPASEMAVSRATSTRERKRKSLVLPRAMSMSRARSPGRAPGQPQSPLRVMKPRITSTGWDSLKSPLMSPTLSGSEFCSPPLPAQQMNQQQNAEHLPHRRQSSAASSEVSKAAGSPNLTMTNVPRVKAAPPSIKDFEIIKPISKGAFGSVYLTKKKSTGDYYAIKALKKADMVAKNQVANVKAERAIMMWQGESDFVAKLYWTFPSKDYIFLVMEYLNGGDCASLMRSLGALPEDWAKRYLAEVILGVEHLHGREIVHRDLKPDNLLIDQKGHLKLTDFGLSRMGLIGRQKRALNTKSDYLAPDPLKQGLFARSTSMTSSRSASFDVQGGPSPGNTPALTPAYGDTAVPSYFSLTRETSLSSKEPTRRNSTMHSESGDQDPITAAFRRMSIYDEQWTPARHSPQSEDEPRDETSMMESLGLLSKQTSHANDKRLSNPPRPSSMLPPPMALFDPEDSHRRFVGTPDYLAPETINGHGQDEMSDWWSIGCILFEFLFGYPPFHGNTPEQVFENILSRKIDWPEDDEEVSCEAKDLMNRLMCVDAKQRLGANIDEKFENGGEEIRKHPWFADIDWDTINEAEPSFVPAPENPEDTEYFDSRGATPHDFAAEFEDQNTSPALTPNSEYPDRPHDALSRVRTQVNSLKRGLMPLHIPKHVRDGGRSRRLSEPVGDDFGQFAFKNLPVLEKANKDVIQKLRAEALQAQNRGTQNPPKSATAGSPAPSLEASPSVALPPSRRLSISNKAGSPSSSNSMSNASPSRNTQPSSPLVQFSAGQHHERRKTSSGSSQSANSYQPANFFDVPSMPQNIKQSPPVVSPLKIPKSPVSQVTDTVSGDKAAAMSGSPRSRSHTVGSRDSDINRGEKLSRHQSQRSQVLDVSPSSSDNDESRQKALLRIQRRRQSKRLSQVNFSDVPVFRPLDALVCEDHPVSRLVMEKLLEKLRCRAIVVANGAEAMRYAMSSVKFDVILMELKLPQISGADVARMVRETKNANCHTPIVAVTGYLRELSAPHHFNELIEKPATHEKLTEVLSRLCHWKPPQPGWTPLQSAGNPQMFPHSNLRNESLPADESPTSASSGYGTMPSFSGRGSSREDSVSSASIYTDLEGRQEEFPITVTRPAEGDNKPPAFGGLGISSGFGREMPRGPVHAIAMLKHQDSAPPGLISQEIRKQPSAELIEAKRKALNKERRQGGDWGDDEDEELGLGRARSRSPRLKTSHEVPPTSAEMLRTDSQNSVVSVISSASPTKLAFSPPRANDIEQTHHQSATTPPVIFPVQSAQDSNVVDVDATPTPNSSRFEDKVIPQPQFQPSQPTTSSEELAAPPSSS